MTRARFSVTFEIVTAESAEHGEIDSRGFVCEGATLRDALTDLHRTAGRSLGIYGIECDSSPCDRPRWVTVYHSECVRSGDAESRSLHIPETVSRSSARRIARIAGARI